VDGFGWIFGGVSGGEIFIDFLSESTHFSFAFWDVFEEG